MTTRAAAMLAVALTACNPLDHGPRFKPAGATAPRDGGTLRFAVNDPVRSLDPTLGYDDVSYVPIHAMFDTLVGYSPTGIEIVPRLAERWAISPDQLVYTFTLRPGIAFSDGAPIVAAHIKYSLERALATPEAQVGTYLEDIDGAPELRAGKAATCRGIVAVSDRQLVLRLTRRNPALLAILAMPFATPQRRDHVEAAGDQLRRRPDANGPFELVSWDEGHTLVMRRNPHFYDPAHVHLDRIEMHENLPRELQFQMFERGELEVTDKLAAPDYLFVTSEPAWAPFLQRTVGMNAFGSRMNVRKKPFDDRRVRQALNYALDRSHTARLLNRTTVASHGILPPGMLGRDPALAPYPHDVARARALLAEAGYPNGFDVDYMTISDEETEMVAASLQADLAEVGVRLHLVVVTLAVWGTATVSPDGPAFSYASWLADFADPINFLDAKFHSRSIAPTESVNDSFYANPELDALLDQARAAASPDQRAALYRRAERILYDDAPWIWDYHRVATNMIQPYVRDYQPHPIWSRDFTSAWLDVGPDGAPVTR